MRVTENRLRAIFEFDGNVQEHEKFVQRMPKIINRRIE